MSEKTVSEGTRYELPAEPPVGTRVTTPAGNVFERGDYGWIDGRDSRSYQWNTLIGKYELREGPMEGPATQVHRVPEQPPKGTTVKQVNGRRRWTRYDVDQECQWAEDPQRLYWQWFAVLSEVGAVEVVGHSVRR